MTKHIKNGRPRCQFVSDSPHNTKRLTCNHYATRDNETRCHIHSEEAVARRQARVDSGACRASAIAAGKTKKAMKQNLSTLKCFECKTQDGTAVLCELSSPNVIVAHTGDYHLNRTIVDLPRCVLTEKDTFAFAMHLLQASKSGAVKDLATEMIVRLSAIENDGDEA